MARRRWEEQWTNRAGGLPSFPPSSLVEQSGLHRSQSFCWGHSARPEVGSEHCKVLRLNLGIGTFRVGPPTYLLRPPFLRAIPIKTYDIRRAKSLTSRKSTFPRKLERNRTNRIAAIISLLAAKQLQNLLSGLGPCPWFLNRLFSKRFPL